MGAIMKVSELIALLQKHPPDMPVAYHKWSEQTMMEPAQIKVMELCQVRIDGWIQDRRPDMPTCYYLVFPGN